MLRKIGIALVIAVGFMAGIGSAKGITDIYRGFKGGT
jgi:hypothetical protein